MSSFWSEAMSSVAENIKQKRKSPFYGAFVFSWIAFNWKPLSIFLFSDRDIYYRINDIEKYLSIQSNLCYPLLSALLLIFFVPAFHALYKYFDIYIDVSYESGEIRKDTKLNNIKIKYDHSKVLAENEAALFAAEQEKLKEEAHKSAAEAKLQTALIEANIASVEDAVNYRTTAQQEKEVLLDNIRLLENDRDSYKLMLEQNRDLLNSATDRITVMEKDNNYRGEIMSSAENKSYAAVGKLNDLMGFTIPETGKTIAETLDQKHGQIRRDIDRLLRTFASHPSQE